MLYKQKANPKNNDGQNQYNIDHCDWVTRYHDYCNLSDKISIVSLIEYQRHTKLRSTDHSSAKTDCYLKLIRIVTTLEKKEVCRTPEKGSVDFQKHPNVSKVPKKG